MKRRRGYFLIEMLVVMTVGASLAGIALCMLYALMISHNAGRERLENSRTISRLAEQFRGDVHAMQKTAADGKDTEIALLPESANDAKVRYQCLDGRIDRCELQGEKIVRQESYMLRPDMEASIKSQAQGDATIIVIAISPKPQTEKIYHAFPLRIEALLGLDLRLSGPAKGKVPFPPRENQDSPQSVTEDKP
ncbi:MAG: prepilin-type N-terminal cleavage/methylation domain-containing protein [Thermoguttaceae bacterium]|jgi:prepilin-type N-terminal cleavage/methylation domain-containing protein